MSDLAIGSTAVSRSRLAVEHVRCPKCQSSYRYPCTSVPVPDHLRDAPGMRERIAREGEPLANGRVHRERLENYRVVERRWFDDHRAARVLAEAPAPAVIAMAEREHDQRERAQLVDWLRTGGAALLLSAVELSRVPADLDGGECPECDAPVELLHSGVRCTSCAWWYCT